MTTTEPTNYTTVDPTYLQPGDQVLVHCLPDGRLDAMSHMLGQPGNHHATLTAPAMPYSTGETVLHFGDQHVTLPAGTFAAKVGA